MRLRKRQSDAVFEFETNLAKAQLDNVELRDPAATDHKTAYADLKKLAPAFDWDSYFKAEKISRSRSQRC